MVGTWHLCQSQTETSLVTQVLVRGSKIQEVLSRFPPGRAASWPVESWLRPRPRPGPAMAAIYGPIAPPPVHAPVGHAEAHPDALWRECECECERVANVGASKVRGATENEICR